jgi:hypothetical protein
MTKESKGSGTPTDANRTCRVADTAARSASAHVYRRPTAALARGRSPPQGSASGHVSWDAAERDPVTSAFRRQNQRRFSGCYPPQPVPAQRAPRTPVVSAGRLMPEAARERIATPPAGTALSLPAPVCLRHRSFDERDSRRDMYLKR